MVKITSKLYRPADLLKVIEDTQKVLNKQYNIPGLIDAKDVVIDLRKMGYKIVKVDDGSIGK